jgi:hypothetical protein
LGIDHGWLPSFSLCNEKRVNSSCDALNNVQRTKRVAGELEAVVRALNDNGFSTSFRLDGSERVGDVGRVGCADSDERPATMLPHDLDETALAQEWR